MTDRTLVILAGGQSRRMGRDKAALPVDRTTLLERIIARLSPVVDQIVVAGGPSRAAAQEFFWVPDALPDRGPLGGMLAGLLASRGSHTWVVACDLPDVEPRLGDRLFQAAADHEAVVPRVAGRAQGTCAVYRTDLAPRIQELIAAGPRAVNELLEQCQVRYIDEDALRPLDPELRSFRNLNTPDDYERWLSDRLS